MAIRRFGRPGQSDGEFTAGTQVAASDAGCAYADPSPGGRLCDMADVTVSVLRSASPQRRCRRCGGRRRRAPCHASSGSTGLRSRRTGSPASPARRWCCPSRDGATLIAVGVGDAPSVKQLRDAAAAFVACGRQAQAPRHQPGRRRLGRRCAVAARRSPRARCSPTTATSVRRPTRRAPACSRR